MKSAEAALEAATHNGTMEQRSAGNADLARAQSERDQAQRDLDALVKLQASGAASGGEVSSARQRLATAEASLHAAQQMSQNRYSPAEVERARAALADAKAALAAAVEVQSKTEIRAPIAGTVYSVSASATEFAEDGKTLIEMADLHNLRVIKYGTVLHVDCHLTVPWYLNVNEAHEEIDALALLIRKEFGESLELFVHSDGCMPPPQCKICIKTDCNVRQHNFVQRIEWTLENVSRNQKHGLPE